MAEPLPIVIDTDGGVDDAAALWWALTSPLVEVVAITTVWGNVGIELATANVCRVLHAAGRDDIPVAVGAGGRSTRLLSCGCPTSSTAPTAWATPTVPRRRSEPSTNRRSTCWPDSWPSARASSRWSRSDRCRPSPSWCRPTRPGPWGSATWS